MAAHAIAVRTSGKLSEAIKIFPFTPSLSENSPVLFIALLGVALFLSLTPAFAAQADQGILEIQIKDHREAIDDFIQLNITIDKILISPKPGLKFWRTGWNDLNAPSELIDLTKYIGKKTARIFRRAIDAGSFDAFHLKLRSIDAVLKKKQRAAPVKNTVGAVQLPFEVPTKGETILIIDLVVIDFSDHPPRGYELAIKGYELFTNGKLIQKVPPG